MKPEIIDYEYRAAIRKRAYNHAKFEARVIGTSAQQWLDELDQLILDELTDQEINAIVSLAWKRSLG